MFLQLRQYKDSYLSVSNKYPLFYLRTCPETKDGSLVINPESFIAFAYMSLNLNVSVRDYYTRDQVSSFIRHLYYKISYFFSECDEADLTLNRDIGCDLLFLCKQFLDGEIDYSDKESYHDCVRYWDVNARVRSIMRGRAFERMTVMEKADWASGIYVIDQLNYMRTNNVLRELYYKER